MKPKEKKPEIIYRIIDRKTGIAEGVYSRAYCNEYDFNSISEAKNSNYSGIYKDNEKYAIAKYKVTYKLLDEDVKEE